jgi:hypothetical protein
VRGTERLDPAIITRCSRSAKVMPKGIRGVKTQLRSMDLSRKREVESPHERRTTVTRTAAPECDSRAAEMKQ